MGPLQGDKAWSSGPNMRCLKSYKIGVTITNFQKNEFQIQSLWSIVKFWSFKAYETSESRRTKVSHLDINSKRSLFCRISNNADLGPLFNALSPCKGPISVLQTFVRFLAPVLYFDSFNKVFLFYMFLLFYQNTLLWLILIVSKMLEIHGITSGLEISVLLFFKRFHDVDH